jgi:magnesium chelatase family protein
MGVGRTRGIALLGLEGHLVDVEVHISATLPGFVIVGLPDTSLNESRDRVKAALANTGFNINAKHVTVNLSPATLPKAGSGFDLAIAVAVLSALGVIDPEAAARSVHLGELGLDGRVRPVRGVLPSVLAAARSEEPQVVVPAGNEAEARLVSGVGVVAVTSLAEVVERYEGYVPQDHPVEPAAQAPLPVLGARAEPRPEPDLADVLGQVEARQALEVAAAGGHHLLLLGAPGAGKTMLAARLPGLLPDLGEDEAVEVTAVHSVAGTFDPSGGLLRRPPFEDPHHTASAASIVGGGSGMPSPGAASRAHRGVLFLDEAPEFNTRVLESLRQPLEHGELVIARASGTARYPARFQLVLAANPCPCGNAVGKGIDCRCSSLVRRRYLSRLSGPLLDRVDLRVEVLPVTRAEMAASTAPEPTHVVARRVAEARAVQRERLAGTGWRSNAEVPGRELRSRWRLPRGVTADLEIAMDRGNLTARGFDRVLRVAWTLADLEGAAVPTADHVGLAFGLRTTSGLAA